MNQKQKARDTQKTKEEMEREARERQRLQAQQQKNEQKGKPELPNKVENNRVQDVNPPDATVGALHDQLRERQRWGLLPPKLAEEMLFSGGKEAPAEYREIISRYYKRMNDFYDQRR